MISIFTEESSERVIWSFSSNSRSKLFPGKLHSRWSGSFKVTKVYSYRVIDISTKSTCIFKVNGSWLKHYYAGEPIDGKVFYNLFNATSS